MSIFSLNAWSVTLLLLLAPSFSAWFLLSRFRCESPFPAQQLQNTYSLYAPAIPNLFDAKVFLEQTKNKNQATRYWHPIQTLLRSDRPEKSSLTKPGQKSKAPRPAPKEWSANHEGSGTNSASNLPAKERQIVTGHYGRSCATAAREREREPRTIWANEESKARKETELHITRDKQKRSSASNTFRKLSSYSVNVVLCALSVPPRLCICFSVCVCSIANEVYGGGGGEVQPLGMQQIKNRCQRHAWWNYGRKALRRRRSRICTWEKVFPFCSGDEAAAA